MTDHLTLWQLFLFYRHNIGLGSVSAAMCVMRHIQLKTDWRATFTSSVMCGLLAFGVDEGLTEVFGLGGKSAYFIAIVIGYLGVDVIMDRLDFLRATPKKGDNNE